MTKRAPKPRLDQYLVEQGLASNLKEAQALVLSGDVLVEGHPAKAGQLVTPGETSVTLKTKPRFVSRAGDKLDGALTLFKVSVAGRVCLDVGASTGGFTDCLLQRGAASVWAVDVGKGLIDSKLRSDPRVHLLEETNFRQMDPALLTETPSLAAIDVSFISLDKMFPKLHDLLSIDGDLVALVKPQFEGTPKEVPGGLVRDEVTRQAILRRVQDSAAAAGFSVKGLIDSSVKGQRKGNQESLLHLVKTS